MSPTPQYIVATSRPWNQGMVSRLNATENGEFHLVTKADEMNFAHIARLNPKYVFVPHWSNKIQSDIFEGFECIIFHMTDLPFGRGGSPLQNLIARGVSRTKISAIRCESDIDAGPVYLKRDLSLEGTAREIFVRASAIIEDMIREIIRTSPTPTPQVGEPTYFKRRSPDEGNLSRAEGLSQVYDYIRMLDADGYPPAFVDAGPYRFTFYDASAPDRGTVVAKVKIRARELEGPR